MIGFMGMGMGMGNHGGIPKVGMRSNSGGINKMEMGSDGSGIGTPLLIDQTNRGMQPWAGPPARVVGQFNGGGFASYGGIGRFGSAGLQNGGGALQHMRAHNTGAPAHPGGPNHGVPGVNGGIGGQQGFTGKQETADPGFYSFDQMFF
ncbi:hypothetical protein HK101_009398 [Irineochytrium annulatum]|nr:hypothetical protein HK101_009398 [Irineochytrium annulatum]